MHYEHLQLQPESERTDRHRARNPRPRFKPEDKRAFGTELGDRLQGARLKLEQDLPGYDARLVLKITLREGESLPQLDAIPGIEILSQEDKEVVIACATTSGLDTLESRLATLAQEGQVRGQQLLYALQDFDRRTPQDRTGKALREQGFPEMETFILDTELWPEDRADRRTRKLSQFEDWLRDLGIIQLDSLNQPSLIMVRLRCTRRQAEELLLSHTDVRTLDLPPSYGLSVKTLLAGLDQIEPPSPPSPNAPVLTILDSGLTSGHPLLKPAVVEAKGFITADGDATDGTGHPGHGTFVAGVGLYGDLELQVQSGKMVAEIKIGSAKVFRDDGQDLTIFVEKAVEQAVQYFANKHQSRLFNISYGDGNKIYDGRHVRSLAYTLDRLSRTLGVLFFSATGNHHQHQLPPTDQIRARYPAYLLEETARLLDPAPALNVITVGGVARFDASHLAQGHPTTIESVPLARSGQPSPFTRSGPSINGAIKPDFIDHAGNAALTRNLTLDHKGLGVLSLNSGFTSGRLFAEDNGTSFAAPGVANKAARLLRTNPNASANLLRALLGAHAHWPRASRELLAPNDSATEQADLLRLVGYGQVDETALHRSTEHCVTLVAEGGIDKNQHCFYALPIPDGFWQGRGPRTITVAIAYTPQVKTTRLDYRATKLQFWFVLADDRDEVLQAFQHGRQEGLPEYGRNRWITSTSRNSGTLQVSRWEFRQRPKKRQAFVVLGRQDANWNTDADESEPYALCARLDVRSIAEAQVNLYNEVRAQLQARAQARVRIQP